MVAKSNSRGRQRALAAVVVLVAAIAAGAITRRLFALQPPDAGVWFNESFETGAPRYGFEWVFPEKEDYKINHLPTGGWDGRGAAQVIAHAGRNQYNLGWIVSPLKRSFSIGDAIYIRFRIRFDDDYRGFVDRLGKNKFVLIGQTRTTPNSRIIVYIHPPSDQFGCTLGQVDYLNNTGPFRWGTPEHFGVKGDWSSPANVGQYGSIGPYVNINWIGNCAPPALVTYGNHPKPPVPGPNSGRPTNGWYHFQIYAQSGEPGKGAFKTWVNNNDVGKPTAQQIGLRDGLGVTGWGTDQLYVGGYHDGVPAQNLGYRIDDFQLGGSFESEMVSPGGRQGRP